jgi:gamma-glutamylputrescine oxidase
MSGHVDSWYARSSRNVPLREPLRSKSQAEICVIGGGLAGLATALDLAERGRTVIVLERHRVGSAPVGRVSLLHPS